MIKITWSLLFISFISIGKGYLHSCEYADSQTEQTALACSIFFEASSVQEGYVGRMAVGLVTMNRVYSERFPDNVIDVVYQPYAFSWHIDGKSDHIPDRYFDRLVWKECLQISKELLSIKHKNYKFFDYTKGSLWYHNNHVSPDWADEKYITVKINNHTFYSNDKKR